ncbi:general stress protein [Bifidobacterium sp. UTCIF-39]|uniref:NAD(P)H-dependent oxidoreductase n=1 Tax=Bifidobacterium sp. UTCIF-39 TaxID=1465359 RepID=UPI0011296597|nr:NAD(P)H-dependent oxidoreductase [Bifidobacterium sp. UTCIF-39]TPF95588.1 general stress protein [Bifidobacterium sp. UTCIF-39]
MSTAVLLFHPNYEASKINRRLLDELAAQNPAGVDVRDEYALYPDFKIDVDAEHAFIEQHDHIVLQFPFYWYSSPALLKQWEDAVLTPGWAYAGGNALDGKTLQLAVSTGSPASRYQKDGEYKHTMAELLSPFELMAFRVDLTWRDPFLVQNTSGITDAELDQAAKDFVANLTK